jgi:peptidoglycan/LPS O-acetylase OafA/YrhL
VLWSLSAELLVNVIAVILFPLNQKVLLPLFFGAFIFIVGLSDVIQSGIDWNGFQKFTGIARAILGFYFGLWSRKLYNENGLSKLQNRRRAMWLYIAFILSAMWVLIILTPYFFVLAALSYSFLVVAIAGIDEGKIPIAVLKVSKYLGRISFQMYLWHPFVFKLNIGGYFARNLANVSTVPRHLLSGTISVVITILLCEVAIRFFEKSLIKIGKRFV